jgi:EmrB/QacA subfamily drug resistance transporter
MRNGLDVWRARTTIAAIFLSALMFGLEISSVPVSLPMIGKLLGGSFADVQWVMNAYTIGSVFILVAAGVLADRYGRRRVFIAALAGFGLSSVACGVSVGISVLIAARFCQGVAGGTMLICGLAIMSHQFQTAAERARAFGIWGIGFGAGLGFGPIIGGALISLVDWRLVFLVHAPVAVVALVLTARGTPESRDSAPGRLDVPGMITLSGALFALVYYITQGPTVGFTSASALIVLALAAMGFAALSLIERRTDHPMLPLSLFGVRPFSGALFGAVAMNFSFWPLIIYLPIFLERGLGYPVLEVSAIVLGYTLPTFVLPPVAERLALRFGAARTIPIALGVIGLGLFLVYLGGSANPPSWLTILPGLLIAGVGLGLANTPVTNTTTGSVPPSRSGMASGIDLTARLTFLAINIAVMGTLFTAGIATTLRAGLPAATVPAISELAQRVASGDASDPLSTSTGTTFGDLVTAAVTHGFTSAALYGAVAVTLLAIACRLVLGRSTDEARQGASAAPGATDSVEPWCPAAAPE